MTTLHLDGVALKQHDEPYPFSFQPYAHQVRLQRLICEERGFVAVNDSPTGGGKTSSWLAPALTEQVNTIAIYPTNALVVDQTDQVQRSCDAIDHAVSVMRVTRATLSDKRETFDASSNGDALERWYRYENRRHDQVILLTNPDVFVMWCRDLYHNPARAYKQFPLAVVDEFHRAGRKEQNTLRYLLDELYERDTHALDSIVFLSATPDDEQETKFDRAMAPEYHLITDTESDERQSFDETVPDSWQSVMPPVKLEMRAAPTFGTADVLLEEDASETLAFCRAGRTAIILDGIHEVKRVTEWLSAELDQQVERIDGFHSDRKEEKLDEFDVLVSNSAVEVGIDFDIDRLIFAGHDHASFLQRLGRLRTKAQRCEARCYVPQDIARDCGDYDDHQLTRQELDELLSTLYPDPRKPVSFDWRYSAPEALEHLDSRLRDTPADDAEAVARAAQQRIQRHFLDGTGVSLGSGDIERTKDAIDWRVLQSLQWYRGDSLQSLVYDRTTGTVRTHDLFYLLRYGDVEFVSEEHFRNLVPAAAQDTVAQQATYVDGFCIYDGTIETTDEGWGRQVAFTGPRLAGWLDDTAGATSRKPTVLPGVKLTVEPSDELQSRVRSLDTLNERLRHRRERAPGDEGGFLCYPISGRASMIQEQYDLGEFFFLYPVAVSDSQQYSLALGTDALYLHCHVMDGADDQSDDNSEFIGL